MSTAPPASSRRTESRRLFRWRKSRGVTTGSPANRARVQAARSSIHCGNSIARPDSSSSRWQRSTERWLRLTPSTTITFRPNQGCQA